MERSKTQLERIFTAKRERRRELARLPVEEKVKILIQLQNMAIPILANRGIKRKPWVV